MGDEELEQARKKKLEAKQAQEQLKATLRMALDEQAYARLMNVSVGNEELYLTAARNILMGFKRMGRKLTDAEVLSLLQAIRQQSEKKTTITFYKK
ncbi:MAG: DNA-binding protein [Candidatus ainarchaeum sp.]|nr:DNA-binding protein [Candidatus ainarchaeum sp.]